MLYLYLKGKDTPFFCDFIHYLYYVHFKKLVFHFEKNALFKTQFCGETIGCIKDFKTYLESS